MHVCVSHDCSISAEARGHGIPWHWSYRQLSDIMWVLGIHPGLSPLSHLFRPQVFVLFYFWERISWLSWNLLCRSSWPLTQKSACLCLPSTGIRGVYHHPWLKRHFLLLSRNKTETNKQTNKTGLRSYTVASVSQRVQLVYMATDMVAAASPELQVYLLV